MKKPQWLIDCWALAPNIAREAELWIADRDRWKERCEAAEKALLDSLSLQASDIDICDGYNYKKWKALTIPAPERKEEEG